MKIRVSGTVAVEQQFAACNAHDLPAFLACFSEHFTTWRMPADSPSLVGKSALAKFYRDRRFNNASLKAELLSRTVLGNQAFDHELIYGLQAEPIESIAVFEIAEGLIQTAWFYFAY